MEVVERLEDYIKPLVPIILTIGNFDGMHRGHCAVLKEAQSLAKTEGGETLVLSFRNHPSEVLRPNNPIKLLCTLPHKIRLLSEFGVNKCMLLTFTSYLANHSAASFIERLRKHIPFSHLVLGHDATLGRDRQGDKATLQELGDQWGFVVHYLDEYRFEGRPISSTMIRSRLQKGDLENVELLLNRPYSIYNKISSGKGVGRILGFPTANIIVNELCLPPLGVYAVQVISHSQSVWGIANLGIAPTVRFEASPLLEVHLFETEHDLYGEYLEVIFRTFIRPEQKFNSFDNLRAQIQTDIESIKRRLN